MSHLITLSTNEITVTLDPMRGNIITSLYAKGREWIYIDQENYESRERPRCGCPILFPYMGNVKDDILMFHENQYKAGIHGIVHTNKWEVLEKKNDFVCLRTESDENSKKIYPFDFQLKAMITVRKNQLIYEVQIENLSNVAMPCDIGFHPFFKMDDLKNMKLELDQEEMLLDETLFSEIISSGKLFKNIKGIKVYGKGYEMFLKLEENLPNVFFWSGKPEKFVVIEPWSAFPNAINEGNQMFLIKQNECSRVKWSLTF